MTRPIIDIRSCRRRPDTRTLFGSHLMRREAARRADCLRSMSDHARRKLAERTVARWQNEDGTAVADDLHQIWRRYAAGPSGPAEAAAS